MTNSHDYCDKTIFSVFIGDDGMKYVHFLGYGYYVGEPAEKPYRFVDYTFFIALLSDVVKEGFSEYESEYSDQFKQYVSDYNEEDLIDVVEHYDGGRKPVEIQALTTNTKCGCYIL